MNNRVAATIIIALSVTGLTLDDMPPGAEKAALVAPSFPYGEATPGMGHLVLVINTDIMLGADLAKKARRDGIAIASDLLNRIRALACRGPGPDAFRTGWYR